MKEKKNEKRKLQVAPPGFEPATPTSSGANSEASYY